VNATTAPFNVANEAISLFLEFRDQHGYDETRARAAAVQEINDGYGTLPAWLAQVQDQRVRNHAKWGDASMENRPAGHPLWLATLGEEYGEACRALTLDGTTNLRAELIDVLAVAAMWIEALDRALTEDVTP
jgi:hypothetical protein